MFVTYYIRLFLTGSDRYNGILMSLLLLVTETIIVPIVYVAHEKLYMQQLTSTVYCNSRNNVKPYQNTSLFALPGLEKVLALLKPVFMGFHELICIMNIFFQPLPRSHFSETGWKTSRLRINIT